MVKESQTSNFRVLLDALDAEHIRQLEQLQGELRALDRVAPSANAEGPGGQGPRAKVSIAPTPMAAGHCALPPLQEIISPRAVASGSTSSLCCATCSPNLASFSGLPAARQSNVQTPCQEEFICMDQSDREFPLVGKMGGATKGCDGEASRVESKRPVSKSTRSVHPISADEIVSALHTVSAHPIQRRQPAEDVTFLKRLRNALDSQHFEMFIITIILANTATMAFEMQYQGLNISHDAGFGQAYKSGDETFPGSADAFPVFEVVFTVIFAMELFARLTLGGATGAIKFLKVPLNWLDVCVVITGVTGLAVPNEGSSNTPQIFRLLRLSKLARIMRLLNSNAVRASLQMLGTALYCSISLMGWSLVLLVVIQCMAALLIGQLAQPSLTDTSVDFDRRLEIYTYYGTFTRALLTVFEVTLGNWGPPCRVLVNNIGEPFSVFFLLYRCVVGFAILNVITAVFVQGTTKAAQSDHEVAIASKQKEQESYYLQLGTLFRAIDASGDGYITWREFSRSLEDPEVRIWMALMEIETNDVSQLFDFVDDGDGQISIDEFLYALPRLKGNAKRMDLLSVEKHIKKIEDMLSRNVSCDTTVREA